MKRCSLEAFAKCPDRALCGTIENAFFTEGSDCDSFNRSVRDHGTIKERLVELLNKLQDSGVVSTPAGFGTNDEWIKNEQIAEKLISYGVTLQEWISVKDRVPKANKLVLCWWQSGDGEREHYGFATFQSHGVWYVSNEEMPVVTHWMPLPQPPKGE